VRRAALASLAAFALSLAAPAPASAQADGLGQLKAFLATTHTGRVAFGQRVAGRGQTDSRESTGTFSFERPGKFRWVYRTPYEQLIVGDGQRLWIYDRDLNQVVVRKLDRALGSTPAALLAGDSALEGNFDLVDAGNRDGIAYVEATPRTADTGFQRVRIGFVDNAPRTMELKDAFGNVTTLQFGVFERNLALDPAQFRFVPPDGADVIGEAR
jgi:outer membrane lipoprotein carrier protein